MDSKQLVDIQTNYNMYYRNAELIHIHPTYITFTVPTNEKNKTPILYVVPFSSIQYITYIPDLTKRFT